MVNSLKYNRLLFQNKRISDRNKFLGTEIKQTKRKLSEITKNYEMLKVKETELDSKIQEYEKCIVEYENFKTEYKYLLRKMKMIKFMRYFSKSYKDELI